MVGGCTGRIGSECARERRSATCRIAERTWRLGIERGGGVLAREKRAGASRVGGWAGVGDGGGRGRWLGGLASGGEGAVVLEEVERQLGPNRVDREILRAS